MSRVVLTVTRLRMKLAEAGLPKGGGVGYEIFDKSDALESVEALQLAERRLAMSQEFGSERQLRALQDLARAMAPELGWDAGPVVGDLQPNKRVRFGECDGDAVFGVLLGVVHEVANHAVQLLGIPLKNHRRRAAEHCHLDVNAANTAGSLGRDLGEVDRLAWTLLM